MSHRYYSRADKGKWVGSSSTRPPVQIPPCDNADLIKDNKLTLIGRVTNPAIQKPIWVINWLIQYWNMEGRVTGKDLGPELFLFRFESEEDLLSVLRRGPYHYKRWMLMLQRWEPIISNSFPNMIPFWVRIHGLPLHYWTKVVVAAVGRELGSLLDEDDVESGRVRVEVDGFENLEMSLPLQLPSGEVISVDLEYEKLEKHCFVCFSLRHEKDHCPLNAETTSTARGMINQENTLKSLENNRKRRDRRNLVSSTDSRIQPSQAKSRQSCFYRDVSHRHRHHNKDSKDSSLPQVRCGNSHSQLSLHAQSTQSSQYIRHSDTRKSPFHRRSNEERRPSNSVHCCQSSRTQRNQRPALERSEAPPPHAQVEPPIELDRALALLGFASLSL